jgi:hypothetical protein
MMIRATEDAQGAFVEREICEFNSFGDVRVCRNWDSGERHRDMQDKRGDWYAVSNE